MASGVKAGEAYVRLSLDSEAMARGLNNASRQLKSFGKSVGILGAGISAIGAGIVTPIYLAAKSFSDFGDNLDKVSARTGIAVESLSELGFAAEQSGAGIEDLEKGIRGMQRGLFDAKRGAGEALVALGELGMEFKDLDGLSPEEQFQKIGDRLGNVEDDSLKAAIAMKVFGKSGAALIPMFGDIKNLRDEAKALGITMSTEAAKSAAELNDAMNRLQKVLLAVKVAVGGAVAPLLSELSTRIAYALGEVIKFVKANKEIIVSILKVGAVISAIGGALVALGTSVAIVGFALGGLSSIIGVVSGVMAGLSAIFAAVVSPIGLAIAAVVALGYAFFEFTETGNKAIEWLKDKLYGLVDYVRKTLGFISAAFKKGGLDLAVKAAWVSIKVEFYNGLVYINGIWLSVYENAMHAWNQISTGVQKALETVMQLGYKAANFISKAFWTANQSIIDAFVYVGEKVAKTLLLSNVISGNTYGDMVENLRIMKNAAKEFTDEQKAGSDALFSNLISDSEAKQKELEQSYRDKAVEISTAFADGGKELKEQLELAKAEYEKIANQINEIPEETKKAAEALAAGVGKGIKSSPEAKTSSAGTFNARAIAGLGISNMQSRTAKATEETAKNTRKLLDNNLAFG